MQKEKKKVVRIFLTLGSHLLLTNAIVRHPVGCVVLVHLTRLTPDSFMLIFMVTQGLQYG